MSITPAVHISNLAKTYSSGRKSETKHALKGVGLVIPEGSFFGLLGPNGAGKSTLINIMAGLTIKSSGNVVICGHDIDTDMRNARLTIGIVPQELVLDTFFTVREALEIYAGYFGVPAHKRRTQEIIDAMGLSDKADARARSLSGGMRRRLLIAKALVHNPKVLVLDEPTAGVDVELRTQLWEYVRELNRNGTTILLTTHYLEEAEELCDQIAIINHGEVVANETKESLMARFESKRLIVTLHEDLESTPAVLAKLGWKLKSSNSLCVSYLPSQTNISELLASLHKEELGIKDLMTEQTDLEDVFLKLTQREAA
jgi:ABC-2 type transport system ATP-binding protein